MTKQKVDIEESKGMKFFLRQDGCHLNAIDANRIKHFLIDNQWDEIVDIKDADIIIVSTCAFIKSRINKNVAIVEEIEKKKREDAELIVCGCLPVIDKEALKSIKNVTFLTPHNLSELDRIVKAKKSITLQPTAQRFTVADEISKNRDMFFIRTNYGCMHNCSFCAVKQVFPELRSKPIDSIVNEIKSGIEKGCTDIGLTAEDLTAYGLDIEAGLIELLIEINKIEGNFNLSLYRLYPQFLIEKRRAFLDLLKSKKYTYLSIPANSGSTKILKSMGRAYDVGRLIELVLEIKKKYPFIKIRNDIMVGHPGETKEDFKQTVDYVTNSKIDILVVFPFCAMPGTRAAAMAGKVPQEEITSRQDTLYELYFKKLKKARRN